VIIELSDEQGEPAPVDELIRLAEIVLKSEGLDDATSVAISLVGESTMAELNERHFGKSGPTDVLSFPIEDAAPGEPPMPHPDGPPTQLGDVFIAPSVVRANAARNEVGYEDEIALMVVHGLLHLLGWDHVNDKDAEAMEKREAELFRLIGRERP